jgi:hypothetical protein
MNALQTPRVTQALSLVFLCFIVLAGATSLFGGHALFSVIALGLFIIFVSFYARGYPFTTVLFFPILFLWFTMYLSGILLDQHAYLPELGTVSEITSSTVRLSFFYVVFMMVLAVVVESRVKKFTEAKSHLVTTYLNPQTSWWPWVVFGLLSGLVFGLILLGFSNGFPLFTQTDRFNFRADQAEGLIFNTYLRQRDFLALLLGCIFTHTVALRKTAATIGIVALIGISVLFAEKFASLITMLSFFSMPILIEKIRQNPVIPWNKVLKFSLLAFGVLSLTIPIIVYIYAGELGAELGWQKFVTRAASQAQLWYIVDNDVHDLFRFDYAPLREELRVMFIPNEPLRIREAMQYPYGGMYHMMINYMPNNLLIDFADRGIALAMGMEAYLLKVFGWLGVWPILALIAAVYGGYLLYLSWSIITIDPIRMFIAINLIGFATYAIRMGDLWMLFGLGSLRFAAVAVVYEIIRARMLKQPLTT